MNPSDSRFSEAAKVDLARLGRLDWENAVLPVVACVRRSVEPSVLTQLLSDMERYVFIQTVVGRFAIDDMLNHIDLALRIQRGTLSPVELAAKVKGAADSLADRVNLAEPGLGWGRLRGYYGWGPIKYFLFEYEQELKAQSKTNRDKLTWKAFGEEDWRRDYRTVEHIYPQVAKDPYWKTHFNRYTVKQRNILRNSLGNLLPVSRPRNATLSNGSFPQKRDGSSAGVGYVYGSYSEIEVAQLADWTPEAILERGIRLLSFMERRWKLKPSEETKKIAALQLGFIKRS